MTTLYSFRFMQLDDFRLAESELLQNLIGVLADIRRPRRDLARGARQRERLADQAELAAVGACRLLRDAEVPDLRVGKHLVDRVNRPARHAGLVDDVDPVGARLRRGALVDRGIE